jgi:glucose/arabinose dehydrogenase
VFTQQRNKRRGGGFEIARQSENAAQLTNRGGKMKKNSFWVGFLLGLSILTINAYGQGAPAPRTIRTQPFLTGLSLPVFITNARDGSHRLFIVQQGGIIKVVQPGTNVATDFINLASQISMGGERGLLGLAFHPQFSTNRRFFVYYTRAADGAIEIAEYKTFENNPNLGDTSTKRVIITIPHAENSNHNGGTIEFGPDGFLYAATGDGGAGNDPPNNAQNINVLLGKFIRINIDPPAGTTEPYSVPSDNPFVGIDGRDEIYAVGVRNPYRFSFDRGGTRQLWVGDVGQNAIEEVDIITRGGNYGWRVYEGTQCTNLDPQLCNPANYTMPIFQYSSADPNPRCSVTGGYVYRGAQNTFPNGAYIYGDYCTGEILIWLDNQQILLGDTSRLISSFGEDELGEIYFAGLTSGTVEKLVRVKASADFDGDLKTDISVFRPSVGDWFILNSFNNSFRAQHFGVNGDIPVPEDYDGDNITDIGVFRPSTGTWFYVRSSDSAFVGIQFGANGDVPVAADYDGDARADIAVFRPSSGAWYRQNSTNSQFVAVNFGVNNDVPIPADFDGDGRADITVFRPSNGAWYRLNSTNSQFVAVNFGANGDIPVPGDFDGDGRADVAVFRSNTWFILRSSDSSFQALQWGAAGDIPVVGDYDGDSKEDIGVFRPSNGTWYISRSSNGSLLATQFGVSGDLPVPRYDIP